ncbi:hypothetical protein Cfla_2433 [Cellulomonas flavigena DSM 20109]|uniref:DUF4304 domain-containing protein n=1 Tax=Cellulomonas flavigena (strain ATCC 482 / DSM 20109 / BCRC 11376 / JCM 18109 / NBRC 3775 / NCIMB 8073 / NRS 134) TaxID=446466 RepID=D5UHK2_CELFN|nr:hypothetical protein [Cellulomonas flavigena]ADG75323.1 hypothetical protein Cfla_2433 [Cellulomonas flavigena DSM 20109]
MAAKNAAGEPAALVRECMIALKALGFRAVSKHTAVRTTGFPSTVMLTRYKYSSAETGPEYDWLIWFACPGVEVVGKALPQHLVGVSQGSQKQRGFYRMRDAVQAAAFIDDFHQFTVPFLNEIDSPEKLLHLILERGVNLSEGPFEDEFARARAAIDLMASCPLGPDGEALAERVIADAVRADPSIRVDVDRYRRA